MYSVWRCCSVDSWRHFKWYWLKLFLSFSSPEHRPFAGEEEREERLRRWAQRGQQKSICVLVPFARGESGNPPGTCHQFPVGKASCLQREAPLQGDMSYLRESKGDGRTTLLTEKPPQWVWPQRVVLQPEIATVTVAPSPCLCAWRGTQPLGLLLILPMLSLMSHLQFPISFLEVWLPQTPVLVGSLYHIFPGVRGMPVVSR